MARITHVKHARQRYAQVPKTDENGKPVVVAVLKRDGSPKTTKTGRPITMSIMVSDRDKPLPMPKCEVCGKTIEPGQPYKHVTPKSGPYGGRTRTRCASCPSWQPWDLSSALWARQAQIEASAMDDFPDGFEETDDLDDWAENVASKIESLADEKEEAADNIEEGFGHETYQSEEIRQTAESLREWAENVRGIDWPEKPEEAEEEIDCPECNGDGEVENPDYDEDDEDSEEPEVIDCEECGGTGKVENEEAGEPLDEWRDECRSAAEEALSDHE